MKYTAKQRILVINECVIAKDSIVEKTKDEICFQLAKKLPFEVKEENDEIVVSLDIHIMTNDELKEIIEKHVKSEWLYGIFKNKAPEGMYTTHKIICDNCENNQYCSQSEYVKKNCHKL